MKRGLVFLFILFFAPELGFSQTCSYFLEVLASSRWFEPWLGKQAPAGDLILEPTQTAFRLSGPESNTQTYRVFNTSERPYLIKIYPHRSFARNDLIAWKVLAKYETGFLVPKVSQGNEPHILKLQDLLGLDLLTLMSTELSSSKKKQIADSYNIAAQKLYEALVRDGVTEKFFQWTTIGRRKFFEFAISIGDIRIVIRPDQIIVHPETLALQINDPE